jgi:TPR repeat protein
MYLQGRAVTSDAKRGFEWCLSAAQLGDVLAQYQLAGLYASGTGTGKDLVRAYQWFTIAAAYGDPDAIHDRQVIAEQLSERDIAIARQRAREWETRNELGIHEHPETR